MNIIFVGINLIMEVSCPISSARINETVVRIIASMVLLIGLFCVVLDNYLAIFFLLFDFTTRAFTDGKFSLLKITALKIAKAASLPSKMTDLAPKQFAAKLGFLFCLAISCFYVLHFETVVMSLTLMLLFFAVLESFLAICVGCYVYTLFRSIFGTKN